MSLGCYPERPVTGATGASLFLNSVLTVNIRDTHSVETVTLKATL